MKMSNKAYDTLKTFALVIIPAIATFWLAIASIWEIPNGEKIGATITAFAALLGGILKISSDEYNKRLKEARKINMQE